MAEDRWSDPLVFGPVYGPDDEDGSQDDGSDGPSVEQVLAAQLAAASDAIAELTQVFDAATAAHVELGRAMGPLVRAFHAPGCGPAAMVALAANSIDYDELCPSTLVPPGQVYVSTEPDMETLELKFSEGLMRSVICEPLPPFTSLPPLTTPKFTLITGV